MRNHRTWVILLAVLLLAGWLRFGFVGVRSFAFDEARLSLIALQTVRTGQWPSLGMPSSAGVPNMPAAAWLFTFPYALWRDPLGASLFVSALNLLAVWGVWHLARRWGITAAWVAGVYVAAHPFAALYARSVWAQNLLIPLAVLWLVAAYHSTHTQHRTQSFWIGLAAFISGFALQVHFAGAAIGLAGAYAFFRWRWWRQWAAVLIGGGLASLLMLPFFLTDGALSALVNTAGGNSTLDASALGEALRLLTAQNWSYLLHGDTELPLQRLTPDIINLGLWSLLGIVVIIGTLLWLGRRIHIPKDTPTTSDTPQATSNPNHLLELALVVGITPILLFSYHSTPVFIHYLLPIVVTGAMMLGWMTADARPRGLRLLVMLLVTGAAILWAGVLTRSLSYTATHLTPNGMAEPLGTLRQVAHAPNTDTPLLFFAHGDDIYTQGEPSIFRALWWERDDLRIVDGRSVLILPDAPTSLLFTEQAFQAWEEWARLDLADAVMPLPRRQGAPTFQLVDYGGDMPNGFTLLDTPQTFAHGAVLLGWRVYQVGPRTRISTLWQANDTLTETLQQFHHLRTDDTLTGEPFMVSDVSVRGHLWRAGDTVIVMGDFFDLSPDVRYTIEVGHYTLPDVMRIGLDNGGDTVRLGTFFVE